MTALPRESNAVHRQEVAAALSRLDHVRRDLGVLVNGAATPTEEGALRALLAMLGPTEHAGHTVLYEVGRQIGTA